MAHTDVPKGQTKSPDWLKGALMMQDMAQKTVLITGASRGIGADTARLFAQAGANVALVARGADAISSLAAEIGDNAIAIPCDVSIYAEVEAAVTQTVGAFGSLDVLIGNAGVIEPIAHLASADPAAWGQVIDINLKGVFYGMRAALPIMLAAGGGTILTVSSGAAHGPVEAWSQYCASKAGAAMLTRCVDKENAGSGIRAMGLSPGTVATQMQREIKASGINPVSQLDWSDHIPADWPARALLWMCSLDADDWIGQEVSLRDAAIRARVGLT
jgi:NAD(P)-dependent dehydrogenase (short-subunit alcohol dehydrogenase family)